MSAALRRHATTIVIAMITAAITAGGPALAAAVYDAVNADKVDGKHAVGAAASPSDRSGKLVATNADGRLPNNIIERAPDAAKLQGRPANALSRMASASSGESMLIVADAQFRRYGPRLTIEAPTRGYVAVTSSVSVLEGDACTYYCAVIVNIRHVQTDEKSRWSYDSGEAGWASVANTVVFPVEAGVNTFETRIAREFAGSGSLHAYSQQMTGVFSPFDGNGKAP